MGSLFELCSCSSEQEKKNWKEKEKRERGEGKEIIIKKQEPATRTWWIKTGDKLMER